MDPDVVAGIEARKAAAASAKKMVMAVTSSRRERFMTSS
jgi:hypothetical protein